MSDAIPAPVVITERPKITRTRVNPFSDHFPIDEGAKVWTFPVADDGQRKTLKRALSQLRAAGRDADRTTKMTVDEADGNAKVTVWTIPKIVHTKPEPAPAAAKAATKK